MANTKTYYTDLEGIMNLDLGVPFFVWESPNKTIVNYVLKTLTSNVREDGLVVDASKAKFKGNKIKF